MSTPDFRLSGKADRGKSFNSSLETGLMVSMPSFRGLMEFIDVFTPAESGGLGEADSLDEPIEFKLPIVPASASLDESLPLDTPPTFEKNVDTLFENFERFVFFAVRAGDSGLSIMGSFLLEGPDLAPEPPKFKLPRDEFKFSKSSASAISK